MNPMNEILGANSISKKKYFPDDPANNQLFFRYPYLYLYRAVDQMWYPLPVQDETTETLEILKQFTEDVYPRYWNKNLQNLDELAEDLKMTLQRYIEPKLIERIVEFVQRASLAQATTA